MKLTMVQHEVLVALIDLFHRSKGAAIKGEDIAEIVGKNPGTIRNQMQSLKALGLVDGVPGPKGGYKPTAEAYEMLDLEPLEKEAFVPICLNDVLLDLSVTGIDLIRVTDPEKCRAEVHVVGNLKGMEIGDLIRIGPTPVNKLTIQGKILGRDDINNILLIDIVTMASVPKGKAVELAKTDVKTVTPKTTIREAAQLLISHHIHGAPVVSEGKPIGVISALDIAKALAEKKEGGLVMDAMSTNLALIDEDTLLSTAIEDMDERHVSRLLVVDKDNKLKGIVSRTDILCRLNNLCKCP